MGTNAYQADESRQVKRDQSERLRKLETENARLKREVAVLIVDKLILSEVIEEQGRG